MYEIARINDDITAFFARYGLIITCMEITKEGADEPNIVHITAQQVFPVFHTDDQDTQPQHKEITNGPR